MDRPGHSPEELREIDKNDFIFSAGPQKTPNVQRLRGKLEIVHTEYDDRLVYEKRIGSDYLLRWKTISFYDI
jgi:hypothetical protein